MTNFNKKINILNLYFPALLSGVALIFAFPPYNKFLLAFMALTPLLASLPKTPSYGSAMRMGVLTGLCYFFGTQYWVYHSINHFGGVSLWLSVIIVFSLALYQSLYTGLFAVLFRLTIKGTSLPAMIISPVFWVMLEYLKTYIITGFPWSSIGYSQYQFLTFIQFADLTGIYGVSFMVVAVNGSLADIFIMKARRLEMPLFNLSFTITGYVLLAIILTLIPFYGNYRLDQERPGKNISISIVQGNIDQNKKWNAEYQNFVIQKYKNLSLSSIKDSPELIVWPESALPFYFGNDQKNTESLFAFQEDLDIPLLTGAVLVNRKPDGTHTLSNSAILLKENNISYRYDKVHLVPFGEYVPLKKLLFFVDRMVEGIGDFESGRHFNRGNVSGEEFGVAICYEIIFPGLNRKFFKDGGSFLVTVTNDAWFGKTPGPFQHFSMSVFRAIENRKPVVRAANTGVSGFIDSSGHILDVTPIFQTSVLSKTIKTDYSRSFYSRFGDLVPYFCIIISIFIFANVRRT